MQGYPAQVYPAQGYPAQGYSAQGYPPQSYPAQVYPARPVQPYPVPGQPYPPAAPLNPLVIPARRRTGVRVLVGVLVVLLLCSVVGVGGLVGYADYTGALDTKATWRPMGANPPPAPTAATSVWSAWARRSVDESVRVQAKALLAADETGFLAAVDPANARLVAEHKRRFKVVRAMGPGVWTQAVSGTVRESGKRAWNINIEIYYCFGASTCESVRIIVASEWRFRNDQLVMVDLDESESSVNGPRPWEIEDLTVAQGKRVVVAATRVNAWRLKDAVRFADRAAAVADTFAKWEKAPSRYVIFLAGPNDWRTWYGREQPEWAAAWAVPVSSTVTEVVVRTQVVQQVELEQLLTHELIHVTSLAGKRDGSGTAWWLIEGIAEYGALLGTSVRDYDAFGSTRTFVRGDWDGDPAVYPPTEEASLDDASGRYGIGYLAVRRIAEKYGKAKMLAFFGKVVHDGLSLGRASTEALGVEWETVKADCARYIRNSVA